MGYWEVCSRDALKVETYRPTIYAPNDSRETLVSLRIVVLEANLQLDCFDEITLLLAVGIDEEVPDEAPHT